MLFYNVAFVSLVKDDDTKINKNDLDKIELKWLGPLNICVAEVICMRTNECLHALEFSKSPMHQLACQNNILLKFTLEMGKPPQPSLLRYYTCLNGSDMK